MMKTIRNSIGSGLAAGMLVLTFFYPTLAQASSQPTFKMEIVAPECTLDTIDDGSGPVLVITCPPGTVTPPGQSGDEGATQGESITDIVASQRIYSPTDTVSMLEILQSSGMVVELPEGFNPAFRVSDTVSGVENKTQYSVEENVFAAITVTVAVAAVVLAGIASSTTLSSGGLDVIRRLWSKWHR